MREGLYAIVGAAGVGEVAESYRVGDATPWAVVAPESEAEVCALMEYAYGARLPCVVGGGGTHLTALAPPIGEWWLLSTRRLNRIIDYSPQDLVLTVGAGTTLQAVQDLLREHNQYLPWNPALPAEATIGGIVASNRAGSWRYRYGTPRDRLLALRAVRPDGVAFKSGAKVVKSVAGYDLHRLLCGAWGSLAVMTEITLKVQPLPAQFDAVGWFTSWQDLEPTLAALMQMPIQPDGISVLALRGGAFQRLSGLRAVSQVEWEVEYPSLNPLSDKGATTELYFTARTAELSCLISLYPLLRVQRASSVRGCTAVFSALTPCPSPTRWERGADRARRAICSPSPTRWERGADRARRAICSPSPTRWERGQGVRAEKTLASHPTELSRCTLSLRGLGGEVHSKLPTLTPVESPPRGGTVLLAPRPLRIPEEQPQPLTDSQPPTPYLMLEFSGRPEGVAWQIQHLREQGYPAEPVAEAQLTQLRDWLAPRTHALMVQILMRPNEIAEAMARWTEIPGVSALAHAGNGVLYIACDESGLNDALLQRLRTLNAKYRVLNGATWLHQHTDGELPRSLLSEAERELMHALKTALDERGILAAFFRE